jgi:hypothetical protein
MDSDDGAIREGDPPYFRKDHGGAESPPHGSEFLRMVLVLIACAVTMLWLGVLFEFPEKWKDRHGYNQLGWLVITSGLHIVMGAILGIASVHGVVRVWFAAVVGLAPIGHLAGSPFEIPWCIVLFVVPSAAIIVAGYFELRRSSLASPV